MLLDKKITTTSRLTSAKSGYVSVLKKKPLLHYRCPAAGNVLSFSIFAPICYVIPWDFNSLLGFNGKFDST